MLILGNPFSKLHPNQDSYSVQIVRMIHLPPNAKFALKSIPTEKKKKWMMKFTFFKTD